MTLLEKIDSILEKLAEYTSKLNLKQNRLISGTNIKTINEQNLLGSGNIDIEQLWESGNGEHSIQTTDTVSSAEGDYSVAEGYNTLARSDYSHAEGWATRTIIDPTDPDTLGHASHAEGSHTIAKGAASHAEGNTTESNGMYSHSEGAGSLAGGIASHAEGDSTITNNFAEHAEGSYNKSTPATTNSSKDGTLHSIGIGTSMNDRKNAFEVLQNGEAYLLGVGDYDGTNLEEADTLQDIIIEKVDKVEGKGLSTNDFTDAEKTKLDGIDMSAKQDKGKMTVGSTEYAVSRKALTVYDDGVPTTYYLADLTTEVTANGNQ